MINLLCLAARSIIAAILCLLLLINLITIPLPMFVVYFFKILIPSKKIKFYLFKTMNKLLLCWQEINYWILYPVLWRHTQFPDTSTLDQEKWYAMIANHATWFDILVINCAFKNKLPPLKFFMKRSLLWTLPIAGFACYILGFPFLYRHKPQQIKKKPGLKNVDRKMMTKACRLFKKIPTTSITFVEGTRFTIKKHRQQHSPYQYLLRPKAGGIATVTHQLQNELSSILDVTIHYSEQATFWGVLCGRVKKITVCYQERPIPKSLTGDYYTNRQTRAPFQEWLNGIWAEKDRLLSRLTEQQKHDHKQD